MKQTEHRAREQILALGREIPGIWAAYEAARAEGDPREGIYITEADGAGAFAQALLDAQGLQAVEALRRMSPIELARMVSREKYTYDFPFTTYTADRPLLIQAGGDLGAVAGGGADNLHPNDQGLGKVGLCIADMVIDIAAAIEGRFKEVEADIAAVRASVPDGKILKVIIKKGKGLEVNTSSFRYGMNDLTPSKRILSLYRDLGGSILSLGSDAHQVLHLAEHMDHVRGELRSLGFEYYCTFEKMKAIFHSL